RVGRVVQTDCKGVVAAELHVGREVHAPAVVAIGPAAHQPAVEPDRGVGHGAVQVQEDATAALVGGDVELPPVPANAPAGQAAHAAVGAVGEERAGDGPVVRQGD